MTFSVLRRGPGWPEATGDTLDADELAVAYAYPDPVPERGWVRASMLSTVDGASYGQDNKSASISLEPDRFVLRTLRGLSDVVLAGAGTTRSEEYPRTKPMPRFAETRSAAGQLPSPVIAVVSRSGEIGDRLLEDDPARGGLIVLVPRSVAADRLARLRERTRAIGSATAPAEVVVLGQERVEPAAAIAALAERGLRRIVCEGGPRWLAAVAADGLLDELCLTTSPMLAGGEVERITSGAPIPRARAGLTLQHVLECDNALFTRWRRFGGAPDE